MLTRAREIGVVHLLNFEFRYDPGRRRVKEIIDSGGIGRVVHMNWNFYNSCLLYTSNLDPCDGGRTPGQSEVRLHRTLDTQGFLDEVWDALIVLSLIHI